jgi:hypothetical protein
MGVICPPETPAGALAFFNRESLTEIPNWEAVAKALRKALVSVPAPVPSLPIEPAKRMRKAPAAAAKAILADYPVDRAKWDKLQWPSPKLTVTFADGQVVRAPAVSIAGKSVNVARGLRVACAFYHSRTKGGYVPQIVSCACEALADPIDPALCNEAIDSHRQHIEQDFSCRSHYDPRAYYLRLRRTLNPKWPAKAAWIEAKRHVGS